MNRIEKLEKIKELEIELNGCIDKIANIHREIDKIKAENVLPSAKVFFKCGTEKEILHYHKYSNDFIEFETEDKHYRYVTHSITKDVIFPLKRTLTVTTNHECTFEVYDDYWNGYVDASFIDHIKLIEGVDIL